MFSFKSLILHDARALFLQIALLYQAFAVFSISNPEFLKDFQALKAEDLSAAGAMRGLNMKTRDRPG